MDTLVPFVNIALALTAYLTTQRITQRQETTQTSEPPINQPDFSYKTDETIKGCIVCGNEEEGAKLLKAPCDQHFVCAADIASYFKHATNDESLFPPRCCNHVFLLQDYEHHVPPEIALSYRMKEQGEYTILAKNRVYCANSSCARFLHPAQYVEDPQTVTMYAKCDANSCRKRTCIRCKTLLRDKTLHHTCRANDEEAKFQQLVVEKGYQTCFMCGAIIELADACNHITCLCGASFCYICGDPWAGVHGCSIYGPAVYNALGYNQDGFHRSTGLDAEGLTRGERIALDRQQYVRQLQLQEQVQQEGEQASPTSQGLRLMGITRIGLILGVFLLPRTSLAARMAFALCVSLVPPLPHWMPSGFGNEYDRYEWWDED